jgi:cyclophilin family peptidyl-prolyl cis-trans isomerase/HEAT repeat protein
MCGVFYACQPTRTETPVNKFSDPVLVKIFDLKDRRLSDSLYQFFQSPDSIYRYEAALAFASIQDLSALDKLNRLLLREQQSSVKIAIAYAIGQTPSIEAERILLGAIMREKDPRVLRELLEAYGKTTEHWQLLNAAPLNDTSKAEGIAWSIYRAGLRGKTDSTANPIAARLLSPKQNVSTRLAAAHFFSRSGKNIELYFPVISTAAKADPSVDVRSAATSALRRIVSNESLRILKQIYKKDGNVLVRVSAIRALQVFPSDSIFQILIEAVKDRDANISVTAAEALRATSEKKNSAQLSATIDEIDDPRTKSLLYETLLKIDNNTAVVARIKRQYEAIDEPFVKSFFLAALHRDIDSFDFISDELGHGSPDVIRSTAANALVEMHQQPGFSDTHRQRFLEILKQVARERESVLIGMLVAPLAEPELHYQELIDDPGFLLEAKKELSLPQDNESMQAVNAALTALGKQPEEVANPFNHPIDWDLVKKIPAGSPAIVYTTKGKIALRLLPEKAPGSVANFVALARNGYYINKYFHRVIPNFVAQGGCKRGDGSGSEDYSIRSEFGIDRYTTGSVGMASAGKDTEGTQWFITHSPTPHLDGRYSIFAEVSDGLDIVNNIKAGDKILKIEFPDVDR